MSSLAASTMAVSLWQKKACKCKKIWPAGEGKKKKSEDAVRAETHAPSTATLRTTMHSVGMTFHLLTPGIHSRYPFCDDSIDETHTLLSFLFKKEGC